jgi:hypothetical protein
MMAGMLYGSGERKRQDSRSEKRVQERTREQERKRASDIFKRQKTKAKMGTKTERQTNVSMMVGRASVPSSSPASVPSSSPFVGLSDSVLSFG